MNRIWFLVLTCGYSTTFAADVAVAKLDLREFGYQFTGSTPILADYTDLGFLSDGLVLISINQRVFGRVEPLFADTPGSTMIVFDLRRGSVVATGKMSVAKVSGSVQVVKGERFAVLNQKGLQFCDATLTCGPQIETQGPMYVSPRGEWIAVGGDAQSQQRVFDTESLKQVAVFEPGKLFDQVIPGDGAFLIDRNNVLTIQRPGKQDARLTIDSKGNFRELRFLNSQSLACLDHDASEVVVTDMDARPISRYKVEKAWRTGFLPTTSGARFGIYEHGYTVLNSIINFLDIDEGRPQDFQRVRVIDMPSRKEVSRLEWDPRPGLVKPALSPSGHRLARVRAGILEVLQVN